MKPKLNHFKDQNDQNRIKMFQPKNLKSRTSNWSVRVRYLISEIFAKIAILTNIALIGMILLSLDLFQQDESNKI